ncbi:hypothetical protein C6I20_12295 [Aeromicrobium sp. A1-2]|uniref:hypothetical protein n=1 Tax=Aeromicrobium sp. A1-2 TaxID=2107713 RepID=UPI000E4B2191|nr:hypothetical protein [Aeromicrobium sp. A1-2]AXT85888.1 hypothetical protein C6I20_12295 [Aeromicrobium sp. A1-2]
MPSTSLAWTPRFAGRPRLLVLAFALVALLAVWGALAGSAVVQRAASPGDDHTDLALYQAIVQRMDSGESYYGAVAIEHPAGRYPTAPVMAVREPTLAWFISSVGRPAAVVTMLGLAGLALILSIRTFELSERSRRSWIGATVMAAAGIGVLCRPASVEQHDVWAALLVYLGVMVRGHGRVLPAVALLLAAGLIRELVAPVMAVMLVMAIRERERREAWWWIAGLTVFSCFYGWHAWEVHQLAGPGGLESPGWLALGGWPRVVDAFWGGSLLTVLPHAVAAVVVPLALLGWISRAGELFDRVSVVLLAYVALFCFVGRADNFYWGMLIGALLVPGLAFGVGLGATTVGRVFRKAPTAGRARAWLSPFG